jgi:hypothetical protein
MGARAEPLEVDRGELQRVALKAFFNITERWGLSDADRLILLGEPGRSTFYKWKSELTGKLSKDVLERISYVLGIYKSLRILFADETQADGWVQRANAAPPFNGRSALEYMKGGHVVDLADVRRYLDAQRGW